MKNFCKKIGLLILVLFAGMAVMAQSAKYQTLYRELQSLQKQLVPDRRVAILEIGIKDSLNSALVISGETDLPDAKEKIIKFLTDRRISFVDSLRLLPASSLGDKTLALAALSVSNLRAQPDHASELVSQALMGTPMKVLDSSGSWYRVQTPEHYIGWIDSAGLKRFTPMEMESWKKSERCIFNRLSGTVHESRSKRSGIISDVVLGDLIEVEKSAGRFYKVSLPDGRSGYVRRKECISFDKWSQSEPKVRPVLSIARQMTGSPYLWGGSSAKAMDCSGLVKLVYYSQGVILARDASQQARYGEQVDFSNMKNLQPGDLLFFGRSVEHITHVGIYLGDGYFIHSSGKVHISSIVPGDPKFNPARNKVAARRVINSLNTAGITRVKEHPWYCIQP